MKLFSPRGERKKISAIAGKVETSGGHRGNMGFYRGKDDCDHRGHRGNQGNMKIFERPVAPAGLPGWLNLSGTTERFTI